MNINMEVWHGKLYVSVQYHAAARFTDGSHVPAITLDRWHTTLVVAYYRVFAPWRDLTLQSAFLWRGRLAEATRLEVLIVRLILILIVILIIIAILIAILILILI